MEQQMQALSEDKSEFVFPFPSQKRYKVMKFIMSTFICFNGFIFILNSI